MTINVFLATSDALVAGVDSVASTTSYFLDPSRATFERDAQGEWVKDADGKYTLKCDFGDFQQIVTNAWGGVTKLFEIHPQPSPAVAGIAGLAKMNDRPIASIAHDFFRSQEGRTKKLTNMQTICNAFLKFMREHYDRHYVDSSLPDVLKDGPTLLVGGYGRSDQFPSIYRIDVKENTVTPDFVKGETGVSWNGQSDAVQRFLRGYDNDARSDLRLEIEKILKEHTDTLAQHFAGVVNQVLDKLSAQLPDGIDLTPPTVGGVTIDWNKYRLPIDYANLPIQDAINFVSFLVMLQAGRSRFAFGVPTVGGRTHIGVVTKEHGFKPLSEPDLVHRFTGFSDDL